MNELEVCLLIISIFGIMVSLTFIVRAQRKKIIKMIKEWEQKQSQQD